MSNLHLDPCCRCRLEDCGGIWGYEQFCEIAAMSDDDMKKVKDDNQAAELEERKEWLGDWHPEEFGLAATRKAFDGWKRGSTIQADKFLHSRRPRTSTRRHEMPRCETCGKNFKSGFALKIHVGRVHKKAKAPKTGRGAQPPAFPAELDVCSLAVDQLIALKRQVDGRLADVARLLRLADVTGKQPGPKLGKKAKAAAKKPRKRGVFKESATAMILRLLAGGKPVSTTEIAAAWKKAGRKGKPSKTLSDLVKAKKVKREEVKGIRANNYTIA